MMGALQPYLAGLGLFMTTHDSTLAAGRARSTDPETSHQAGAAVTKLRASQALVLNVFRAYGDMNDKDLLDRVHATQRQLGLTKLMSPSGVRSRRSELSKANMDRLDEMTRSLTGTAARFTDIDEQDLAESIRRSLRIEGFKSPLWDTGRREVVDERNVIVWGIAR